VAVPSAPPASYEGTFFLDIGTARIRLTGFAGCYDKVIGVEYEDCYFETRVLAGPLLEWASQAAQPRPSRPPLPDLRILRVDANYEILEQVDVKDAFLRSLEVSTFDAGDTSPVTLTVAVVPGTLSVSRGSGRLDLDPPAKVNLRSAFSLAIEGTAQRGVIAVEGPRLSVEKLDNGVDPSSRRRLFASGDVSFAPIRIVVSTNPTFDTAADFDDWVADVSRDPATRPLQGELEILDAQGQTDARITLEDLRATAYPPFATGLGRRTLTVQMGRFGIR